MKINIMKTFLSIIGLCIINISVAQNTKSQIDNLVKTFALNGIKTLSLKVDNKNITIKTWKQNTIQLSTYIKSEKNIDNYSFDTKIKGEIFKINATLKNNKNNDAIDNGKMISNARASANDDALRKATKRNNTALNNEKQNTLYNYNNKWYSLEDLKLAIKKEQEKTKNLKFSIITNNGKTTVIVNGKILEKIDDDIKDDEVMLGIEEATATADANTATAEARATNKKRNNNNHYDASGEGGTINNKYYSNNNVNFSYNYSNSNCSCEESNDITLTIPENLRLNIDNNNGNVSIVDDLESLVIESKNGNVTAKNIIDLEIEASYTNFELNDITNANIDANGCNFTSGNFKNLILDTKFGNYELENVQNLTLTNSQSDEFDIAEVGNLTGKFSFSNMKIQKITSAVDLDITSGDIKIKNVNPLVSKININGKFTEIDVTLRNTSSYSVLAKTIFSTIKSNGRYIESNNEEQEFKDIKGEANKTKITMNCNSCTITLK